MERQPVVDREVGGAEVVVTAAERVAELHERRLAVLDEVGQVVGDDVAHDDRHDRVREEVGQRRALGPRRHAGRHAGDGEDHPDAHAEGQQRQVVDQSGGDGRALHEPHPRAGLLEGVVRRAAEEHRDDADESGGDRHGGQVGQRAAQDEVSVALAPDGELGHERGVDLEGVGALEEAVAEQGAADEHDADVDRAPQADRADLRRVRVDELEPHEGEEAHGRRPVAQPCGVGVHPDLGIAAGDLRQHGVDRAAGADRLPDRAEQHRQRHDADPQEHVEDPEERVDQGVLAEDGRGGHVQEHREAQRAQADPPRGRRGQAVEPGRRGTAGGGAVVARRAPGEGQDREGDHQGRDGTGDRELEGDRQVLGPADAVGEQVAAPGVGPGFQQAHLSGLRAGRWRARGRGTRPRRRRAGR